jgi:hypothetical protein
LASVPIPNSVTRIGGWTFFGCASLTSFTIPNSVTGIGDATFRNCTDLTSVVIPDSVTSIGWGVFENCTRLTSVTIPNSVTNMGVAFSGCTSLSAIRVEPLNSFYSSVDGVLFDKSETRLIQYPGGKAGSYTISTGVTSIGWGAFENCTRLTSVTIPTSVTSIGGSVFWNCTRLTNVTIPNSITSIGNYAFVDCTSLTKVTMPDSITNIGVSAFSGCISLASVFIPGSVTSIGGAAFKGCNLLGGIYCQGNAPITDSNAFAGSTNATVYYLSGTTGWGPTFAGRPTALWKPQARTRDASFGVRTNQFGFNIAWASGQVVVVEVCTNLANPTWSPLQTNTLSSDSLYFSDPAWTNYPSRFYRNSVVSAFLDSIRGAEVKSK